uniref:Uncharacterized protein n=1 Tax=Streptomyces sp. NBC_01401 TaxID=2903854 RepID=A0AAU3H5C8_9ACTN
MTGDNYHFGDSVNINGGHGHTGIAHHHHAPQPSLDETLRAVIEMARALRGEVSDEGRASIDGALPALAADGSANPVARRRSLAAVAAVAASVGAIGQPLLDTIKSALELLGR